MTGKINGTRHGGCWRVCAPVPNIEHDKHGSMSLGMWLLAKECRWWLTWLLAER